MLLVLASFLLIGRSNQLNLTLDTSFFYLTFYFYLTVLSFVSVLNIISFHHFAFQGVYNQPERLQHLLQWAWGDIVQS